MNCSCQLRFCLSLRQRCKRFDRCWRLRRKKGGALAHANSRRSGGVCAQRSEHIAVARARIGFADRAVDVCIAVGDKTSFGRMERERNGANALGKPCGAGLFFGGLLADGGAAR